MFKHFRLAGFAGLLLVLTASFSATAQTPDWAVGTFSGTSPSTRDAVTLTIERNGSVTVFVNGSATTGTYSRDRLNINGAVSKVSKTRTGIRTTRIDNGERIDYVRQSAGMPAGSGGVPGWAVGTFTGSAPNGAAITLTVASSGNVTANIAGTAFYGSISGDILTMNGATARISQLDNGISTVRTDNGERIDYIRRGSSETHNGAQMGDVPDWAVGTFREANPDGSGPISITIDSSGRVTADIGGTLTHGIMYQSRLTLNGADSEVTRVRNGIRTRRLDNGQTAEYFKR